METVQLDPERQIRAREYARIRRRLMLLDLGIGAVYVVLWLALGWSLALRNSLLDYTKSEWLLVAGFLAVFGGIYYLLNLPLGYYSGFILPHRFDLSNQTLGGYISDQLKGLLISVPFGLLLIEIIYAVLRAAPNTWWLWAAAIMLFFNVLLANIAPVLIAPLFYKFEPLQDSRPELADRLIELARQANVKVRGVFKFDMSRRTSAANAALTGLGNTRRIILGDTLLNDFSNDEIETVLAHELGHHVHNDIPVGIIFGTLTTLIGFFLAGLLLRVGVNLFGFTSPADPAAMPLLALVIGAYGLLTMPLENAYSRWRERRADEYSLQVTHKPVAFASAMTRLANQNLSEMDPAPWVVFLLYSHPPIGERVAMAEGYANTVQQA